MKRLILHIGLHKTGTTYLQHLLVTNKEVLEQHNVALAQGFDTQRGHHHRLVKLLRQGDLNGFVSAANSPDRETILLSSEALGHWLQRSPDASKLAQALNATFDVRVVLFLRRQDYLKESVFAEVATNWFQGQIRNENHYQYDFEKLLNTIESLFGKESIGVRVYRDDEPNDLKSQFLSAAELKIPQNQLKDSPPQRVSLHRRKVMLLARLSKSDKREFRALKGIVTESEAIRQDPFKFLMSPQQRAVFLKQFLASNQAVSERYQLDCGDYLYRENAIASEWSPPAPISIFESISLAAALKQSRAAVEQNHGPSAEESRQVSTPKISVVVIFYNMQREAKRTLHSLTAEYQRGVSSADYEVIAIDSGSSEPLSKDMIENLPANFRYHFVEPSAPTPCEALNTGIRMARADYVSCSIDGARILSPGILSQTISALQAYPNSMVYTMGMHLGPKRQTLSIAEGYCQAVEDELLDQLEWEKDGYRLFECCAPAGSSQGGYLRPMAESNFFTARKDVLLEIGGFDESFQCSGGGLVNLDIFNRLLERPKLQPILLLGEASFHQFHGGVSTNVLPDAHPLNEYKAEYRAIRGCEFESVVRDPLYFGKIHPASRKFLDCLTK